MGEPLGRSQVLAYLFRLADRFEITLISFEKDDADIAALGAELSGHGIHWVPLRYHKRPPVLSTLLDVLGGVRALSGQVVRHGRPAIVHVRSDVPALIASLGRRVTAGKLIFDIRGFWADERIEGGIWPEGALYRLAKRCERWFYASADAVVTLTEASVPAIREWSDQRDLPVIVIPTCANVDAFAHTAPRDGAPHSVWCGSIGTWYRFDLAAALAAELGLEFDVITRQRELAQAALAAQPDLTAEVRELPSQAIPGAMCSGDVGICLCIDAFSKTASAPTRFAEHLAAGMPVAVTASTGDLAAIVEQGRVGVVIRDEQPQTLRDAARELLDLAADPETAGRCRALARELFDVDAGARRYAELYDELVRG